MEKISEKVSTQGATSHSVNGKVKEVITVFVPSKSIGESRFSPPNPYEFSLTHEMRSTYFHDGKKTGIQLPRWSNEYSVFDEKKPLEKIVASTERITAIYKDEKSEWAVYWDVKNDEWGYSYEKTKSDNIKTVWSTKRNEETLPKR